MSDLTHDTIFALSSGRPPAAIAVVRISGPRARVALETLIGRVPQPRHAALVRVRDPASGESIDEALALWFPSPRSETGEDMAELQLHGGRAVIAAVLDALGRLEGFRPAEAGEFTRRAFENGRLDLTAVEGLADLIGAETEAQRRQAYRQLKGLLGGQAETWRGRLIEALALVEAGIDFSDEADVPKNLLAPALTIARSLHEEISAALAQTGRGERLRDGLVVAIAGPPNVGKSTLLNRIARREAAIVSPYAGTTRDVIEVHLDLGGYPVTLLDTAGVRETDDPVEQEGVRRARDRAASADLVLWVVEAGGALAYPGGLGEPMADLSQPAGKHDRSRPMTELPGPLAELMKTTPVWLVRNKADLLPGAEPPGPSADPAGAATLKSQRQGGADSAHSANPTGPSADGMRTATPGQPSSPKAGLLPLHSEHSLPAGHSPSLGAAREPVPERPHSASTSTSTSTSTFASSPVFASAFTSAFASTFAHNSAPHRPHADHRNESVFVSEFEFTYLISTIHGKGIETLLNALTAHVQGFFCAESGLITRQRHRHALQEAQAALARALVEGSGREEILAEELRLASRALGRLTGKVDVEDILDVIFRDFCIGK